MCRRTMETAEFDLRLVQVFGFFPVNSPTVSQDDLITSLRYSRSGEYLAVADQSHRIVVFSEDQNSAPKMSINGYFFCKQSSKTKGSIHALEWLPQLGPQSVSLLAATDRTIQIWRVPCQSQQGRCLSVAKKATWNIPHDSVVHSLSISGDATSFLSSDAHSINLHRLDRPDISCTFIDNSPRMYQNYSSTCLSGSITSAVYHPTVSHFMAYGDNHGYFSLCDLRVSSDCISSIVGGSDVREFASSMGMPSSPVALRFSTDGHQLMCRDVLGEKVFDLRALSKDSLFSTGLKNTQSSQALINHFEINTNCKHNLRSTQSSPKLSAMTPRPTASHSLLLLPGSSRMRDQYNSPFFEIRLPGATTFDNQFTISGTFSNTLAVHDRISKRSLYLSPSSDYYLKSMSGKPVYIGRPYSTKMEKEYQFNSPLSHLDVHPGSHAVAMGVGASLCLVKISQQQQQPNSPNNDKNETDTNN